MGPRDYIGTLRVEKELIMNLDDNYSPRCMKMPAGEVNIHYQKKKIQHQQILKSNHAREIKRRQ